MVDVVIIVVICFVGWSVVRDVLDENYAVDPIHVAPEVAKNLQDGAGLVAALQSEVGRQLADARTGAVIRTATVDAERPSLSIAGTNVPLRYFAELFRDQVRTSHKRIAGELSPLAATEAPRSRCLGAYKDRGEESSGSTTYRFTLHFTGGSTEPFFDCVGSYSALMRQAGFATLSVVDPYTAGILLSKDATPSERTRALVIVRAALAQQEESQAPTLLQRWIPLLKSDVPRGHLALGYIHLDEDNADAAKREFIAADQAFSERDFHGRHYYAAQDARSAIEIGRHEYLKAERYAALALQAEPRFDSALYHLAQAKDLEVRDTLNKQAGVSCLTIDGYGEAVKAYDLLIARYPRFSIGYAEKGILELQLRTFRKDHDLTPCLPNQTRSEHIDRLDRSIDEAFGAATTLDPDGYFEPYLQWGALRIAQAEGYGGKKPSSQSVRANVDDAVRFLERAKESKPSDYWLYEQLATAYRLRWMARGKPLPDSDAAAAFTAFCQAAKMAKEPADRDRNANAQAEVRAGAAQCH